MSDRGAKIFTIMLLHLWMVPYFGCLYCVASFFNVPLKYRSKKIHCDHFAQAQNVFHYVTNSVTLNIRKVLYEILRCLKV